MPKCMKGSYSAFAGALALIVMFYMIAMAAGNTHNNETAIAQTAAMQTNITSQNTIRLLDKAVSDGFHQHLNLGCNPTATTQVTNYLNTVINSINSQGQTKCRFTNSTGTPQAPTINQGAMTVSGYLECTTQFSDKKITKRASFSFNKNSKNLSGNCIVYDEVSDCQEQPTFNPACDNT